MLRLVFRAIVFLTILYIYIFHHDVITSFVEFDLFGPLTPLHFLWAVLMLGMAWHLMPRAKISMSGRKSRESTYVEPEGGYDKLKLLEYVQQANVKAWRVLLLWVCFNSIFGILYLRGIIGEAELIMLTVFYYMSDLICMMLFCPFQKFMMKNRCCVNCRIFDWGHFMMYTPMVFIQSFFSWSLLFTSIVVLLRWEIAYARHPERFWRGSNDAIRCENCKDKMCHIKKPLLNDDSGIK